MKLKDKLPGAAKREAKKTEREKIDERREEVLTKGRKFKYPMQYSKHWLVLVTISLALLALTGAGAYSYVSLYKTQEVNDILYRLTLVLPVPVAKVEDKSVRYSDYLMFYRSSITPVEQQSGSIGSDEDAISRRNFYRRQALTMAEDYAYADKLAKELNISVTNEMVDQAFLEHRKVSGTERSMESFLKVLKDNFGLTESEYRRMLYLSLLKAEVQKAIDSTAEQTAIEVETKLVETNNDFEKTANELGLEYEDTGGLVNIMNVDGGRSAVAFELEPGTTSGKFISRSGDCYYFLKLLQKTDNQVKYASIKIPFTELNKRLEELRTTDKIKEYITIDINSEPTEPTAE